MKLTTFIAGCLLLTTLTAFPAQAQEKALQIYRNGIVIQSYPITNIDSIKFIDIISDTVTYYAKISITTPPIGTRSMVTDMVEPGLASEFEVKNIYLILYDEDKVVGTGVPTAIERRKDGGTDITETSNIVFKLSFFEDVTSPIKVIAFVNYSNNDKVLNSTKILEQSIQNWKDGGLTVDAKDIWSVNNGFVMTNSGYYDGSSYVLTADLNRELIFDDAFSAASSTQPAATVYVENLAAKVSVGNKVTSIKDQTADVVIRTEDNTVVRLVFDTENAKWGVTGTAKEMYLLKKQFINTDVWMNSSYSSYWAEGANWNTNYDDYIYNYNDKINSANKTPLNYLSLKDIKNGSGLPMSAYQYVPEHTYNSAVLAKAPLFNVNTPSTSVIIVGKYEVEGGTTDYSTGLYLVYIGVTETHKPCYTIYNEEEFINRIKGTQFLYLAGANTPIPDEQLTTSVKVEYKDGRYSLTDTDRKPLYTVANNYQNEHTVFDRSIYARHYIQGLAYFYVPIKHYYTDEATVGSYGIVRNHSYQMFINSVTGLGVPINEIYFDKNTNEPTQNSIIPDDESKDAYINTSITVLKWKPVDNSIDL